LKQIEVSDENYYKSSINLLKENFNLMNPIHFRRNRLLLIPLVGILIAGVFLLSYGISNSTLVLRQMMHGMFITAGLWLGSKGIVMWLWKKYPWEQQPVKHLLLEIGLILIYTLSFSSLLYFVERSSNFIPPAENIILESFITVLITFFITSIYESVFFYQQWKYNFSKSVRLEKDNIEARYEALKTQVNPHFLFNSLNSLTTIVDNNREAVEYIGNLSDFLRYMLKSSDKELVLLRDEIMVLNKYISLQKSRFGDNLQIETEVKEEYYHFVVPPLVIQMLVENCLKHNILSKDKPLKISIKAEKDIITVENNLQRKTDVLTTGHGLKNITERYRHFTSREINIRETKDFYKVSIPLLEMEL
jgi:sensor histidine kinase YesM